MEIFYEVLVVFGAAVLSYGIVAAGVALYALVSHKDLQYKEMYQQHLDQKRRVENQLKISRESLTKGTHV